MSTLAPCRISRWEGAFRVTQYHHSLQQEFSKHLNQNSLCFLPRQSDLQELEPKQPPFNELIVLHTNI